MAPDSRSVQDLINDPDIVISPGPIIVGDPDGRSETPPPAGDPSTMSATVHHIDHVEYIDESGHLHAVLFDTVMTSTGFNHSRTMEILDDVIIG